MPGGSIQWKSWLWSTAPFCFILKNSKPIRIRNFWHFFFQHRLITLDDKIFPDDQQLLKDLQERVRNMTKIRIKCDLFLKFNLWQKVLLLIMRYLTLSWYVGTAHESIFANKQKKEKHKGKRSWASLFEKNKMGNSPVKPGMQSPGNVYRMMLEKCYITWNRKNEEKTKFRKMKVWNFKKVFNLKFNVKFGYVFI